MSIASSQNTLFQLHEFETQPVSTAQLTIADGTKLWQVYDQHLGILNIQFPSPKTNHQWLIRSQGWVGFIRINNEFQIQLSPRFPLKNLFTIWAYAYGFDKTPLMPQVVRAKTIVGFHSVLAHWLAKQVIAISTKGFAKAYIPRENQTTYVRGRLLKILPRQTAVLSKYDELTTNVPDNQIIAYTLNLLLRSQNLESQIQPLVRHAAHIASQVAKPLPYQARACYGRDYNRLTQHYQPLHQLCGFFLEQLNPSLHPGQQNTPSFLMYMPRLFERFVANWLEQNLPSHWQLNIQESVPVADQQDLIFKIDIVLYNQQRNAIAVLDTKYKTGTKIAASDVHQLVTYAKLKQCHQAILIYPTPEQKDGSLRIDDIQLSSVSFDLNRPIEEAGHQFIKKITQKIKG